LLRCEGLHPGGRFASYRAARLFLGSLEELFRKKAGDSDSRRYAVVQQIALYHHAGRVQAN
jgi:hypothetical protein